MKKYDKSMMATAQIWAAESYCVRKQVGAVISNQGRPISVGYNGTVTGAENVCEESVGSYLKCTKCNCEEQVKLGLNEPGWPLGNNCVNCNHSGFVKELPITKTKDSVVHAEANAILFATRNGIKTEGCSLYITLAPCIECSKMIIQSGIAEVIYKNDYSRDGINFLSSFGVNVRKYDSSDQ